MCAVANAGVGTPIARDIEIFAPRLSRAFRAAAPVGEGQEKPESEYHRKETSL